MADYHVSAGVFGIYAGTLMPKKDGKPSYVKFMKDDQIYIFRMYVDNLSIRHEVDAVDLADDCRGFPIFIPARTHMSLSLDAHCVPDHDGALMRWVKL